MKSKASTILLAAIATAALLLPGVAAARTRPANRHPSSPALHPNPPQIDEQFALVGTHGFEVEVSVTNRRRLQLFALKFGNVIESATYSVRLHPRRGSDAVVARLGKLGLIDVRFVPGKVQREKPPKGCRGPETVIERGHFVGTIAFHSEHGFTEVDTRRAPGAITRTPVQKCPASTPPPNLKKLLRKLEALERQQKEKKAENGEEDADEEEDLSVRLTATARHGRVTLTATKVVLKEGHAKPVSLTNILVLGKRVRGRIKEESAAVYIFGKGSTFDVPDRKKPASEGVLKPPAPFSGSATFRRHRAKAPSWTGNLKIDLPGFGQARLAGPDTHASMCEGLVCQLRGLASERSVLRIGDREWAHVRAEVGLTSPLIAREGAFA